MIRAINLSAIVFLPLFLISCNSEINTSDPQASSNITSSKQNGFFDAEYIYSSPKTDSFTVPEAWVEAVWFNKLRGGKVVKEKTDEYQLNFRINWMQNSEFIDRRYLSDWQMKDDQNTVVGSGNGVYILFLKNKTIPDKFHISICKIKKDDSFAVVTDFLLSRSK